VNPKGSFQYENYTIPAGYAVSMSSYHMHHNESIFPDSNSFEPLRWVPDSEVTKGKKPPTRYLVSFTKGTRQCVGMHLAYAELYIVLANVFRRFDLELWETGKESVELYCDKFVPRQREGVPGVRVLVKA
jgi:cytochrome P450